jgi:purine-nucleoside phosphorylase
MTPAVSFEAFRGAAMAKRPALAVVLGSGLGDLAGRLAGPLRLPLAAVPGLAEAGVPGHRGCLALGNWAGCRVLLYEGRLHFYEGHPWERIEALIGAAAELGARRLLLTNAAGGIRESLRPGSLMVVRSQIDATRPYWWRRPAAPSSSDSLAALVHAAGQRAGVALQEGTYVQVTGPCYETPAEVRALRSAGADAVGMSTAREVEAARALGLGVAAVSGIANRAAGLGEGPLSHEEVLAGSRALRNDLAALVDALLPLIPPGGPP